MEGIPVVEVIQIDGIADAAVIGTAYGAANAGAGVIGVDVAGNGGIQCGDGFGIELGGVGFDPFFRLHVGGLGGDEGEERIAIDAEAIEHHLIIAHAAAGVICVKFPCGGEGSFLPEARKVKDTEGACGATANGRYDTHNLCL